MTAFLTPSYGAIFGFRWSLVGCIVALFYIASCDLFIPPDRSVPRYNTVIGERRVPMLNPGGSGMQSNNSNRARIAATDAAYGQASNVAPQAKMSEAAPASVAQAPVRLQGSDPALAEPVMSKAAPAKERSFWSSLAFWESDEQEASPITKTTANIAPAPDTVAVVSTAPVAAIELAPLPNTNTQLAGNYPVLSQTPALPNAAATDSTMQRMNATQGELKAVGTDADAARTQLLKDATSEPTLLNNPPPQLPATPTSRVRPIENPGGAVARLNTASVSQTSVVPKPALAPSPLPATLNMPVVASATSTSIALPPPPPPMQTGSVPSAPSSVSLKTPPAAVPFASVSKSSATSTPLEPIRLVPPSSNVVTQGTQIADVKNVNASSGIAPITLQQPAPRYANAGYLPQSRYSQRRSNGSGI